MEDIFLTINSLRLDRVGFCGMLDMTDLLQEGEARGANFVADGVTGSTFLPKVTGELRALVQLQVEGEVDKDGVAHPDRWSGIRANVEQIRTSCVVASKSALVTATLTYPDDVTRSADVECPRLDVGLYRGDLTGGAVLAVLEIVIPAGQLT